MPTITIDHQVTDAALAALDEWHQTEDARQASIAERWIPCADCVTAGYDPTPHFYTDATGEQRVRPVGWPNGHRHARPDQIPRQGWDWDMWFVMAGRGYGKTRAGAEECVRRLLETPRTRGFILTPRLEDARTVALEGESGILAVLRRHGIDIGTKPEDARFNRSTVELWLPNGSYMKGFGGRDPDAAEAFRGPQWHFGYIDEPGSIRYGLECLQMARLGLRLSHIPGDTPQLIVTGTPRRVGLVRQLVKDAKANPARNLLVNGRTADNAANLATNFIDTMQAMFGGTALGQQELDGILLDDVEGALWRSTWINKHRVSIADVPPLDRVVVAVDTAASNRDSADEVGIIVAGMGMDGVVYVLEDHSTRGLPSHWSKVVIDACAPYVHPHTRRGVSIVFESNLVPEVMLEALDLAQKAAGTRHEVRSVHASESKQTRAEPVSMLYDTTVNPDPKIVHVGFANYVILDGKRGTVFTLEPGDLAQLEDEMTSWIPSETKKSPNRVDALVWAINDLALGGALGTAKLARPAGHGTNLATELTKALGPAVGSGSRRAGSIRTRPL
jgi:phage terminase large subunit-like protein